MADVPDKCTACGAPLVHNQQCGTPPRPLTDTGRKQTADGEGLTYFYQAERRAMRWPMSTGSVRRAGRPW